MDRAKSGSARSRSRLPPLSYRKPPVARSVSEWNTPSPDPLAHARGYPRWATAILPVAMSVSEWTATSPGPLAHARGYPR
jgi:hypothetical protein